MAKHPLAEKLTADALTRFTATGDPYGPLTTDGNFRAALLRSNDCIMIISGAALEEAQRRNGGNGRWGRVRRQAPPLIGAGTLVAVLAGLLRYFGV